MKNSNLDQKSVDRVKKLSITMTAAIAMLKKFKAIESLDKSELEKFVNDMENPGKFEEFFTQLENSLKIGAISRNDINETFDSIYFAKTGQSIDFQKQKSASGKISQILSDHDNISTSKIIGVGAAKKHQILVLDDALKSQLLDKLFDLLQQAYHFKKIDDGVDPQKISITVNQIITKYQQQPLNFASVDNQKNYDKISREITRQNPSFPPAQIERLTREKINLIKNKMLQEYTNQLSTLLNKPFFYTDLYPDHESRNLFNHFLRNSLLSENFTLTNIKQYSDVSDISTLKTDQIDSSQLPVTDITLNQLKFKDILVVGDNHVVNNFVDYFFQQLNRLKFNYARTAEAIFYDPLASDPNSFNLDEASRKQYADCLTANKRLMVFLELSYYQNNPQNIEGTLTKFTYMKDYLNDKYLTEIIDRLNGSTDKQPAIRDTLKEVDFGAPNINQQYREIAQQSFSTNSQTDRIVKLNILQNQLYQEMLQLIAA